MTSTTSTTISFLRIIQNIFAEVAIFTAATPRIVVTFIAGVIEFHRCIHQIPRDGVPGEDPHGILRETEQETRRPNLQGSV